MIYIPTFQTRSVRDQIYEALKQQIINLQLLPGAALSENEMANQFNVSRTPIRESFVRLAQEGLVQVLPQRGTFVALIDLELVEEARFMRLQLEAAIIQLACHHFPDTSLKQLELNLINQHFCLQQEDVEQIFILDQQFHSILFTGVNKSHIWSTMNNLTVHLDRSRKLRLLDNHDWQQIYAQHQQLIEAIKQHDSHTANEVMNHHLSRGRDDLILLREKYPHYFTN